MKKFCFGKETTAKPSNKLLYHDLMYSDCCCIVHHWIFQHLMDKWILCSDDQHRTSVHQMDGRNRKKIPVIISLSLVCYKSHRITKKYFCNLQTTVIHPNLFNSFPQIWNSCNDTGALDKVPKSMGHLLTTFL